MSMAAPRSLLQVSSGIWHNRFGHPFCSVLCRVFSRVSASNSTSSISLCHVCSLGKATQLPFEQRSTTTTAHLQFIHMDVWGPSSVKSQSGHSYYFVIIDDFTTYTWLFLLIRKADVFLEFSKFKVLIENLLSLSIKMVQINGGGEFVNKNFQSLFQNCGILHRFTCPYTTQ